MDELVQKMDQLLQEIEKARSGWLEAVGVFAWPLLVAVVLFYSRLELRALLRMLADRLASGALLKIGVFEVGAVNIDKIDLAHPSAAARPDDGTRTKDRDQYYAACRHVLLVHRLARSRTAGQLFDILVYLIPHEDRGTLASIQKVEYFLGRFWKSIVFTSTNRYAGFPARFSAYGPTLCSAKLFFTDGQTVILHRYLDFEMGGAAPVLANANEPDSHVPLGSG